MPKVKGYRAPSRTVKLQTRLENALHEAETYSCMSRPELCKALKISPTTLWRKLQTPDDFTLQDLRMLAMLSGKGFSEFLVELVK